MTLEFDEAAHAYTWDGSPVPSVTQVLHPLDAAALAAVPAETLEFARMRGTVVHKACEFYDQGRLDESSIDPQIAGYIEAWKLFRAQSGYEPVLTEARVYHERYRYAGTLDSAGMLNGKAVILDRKTSLELYPSVGPQLAGYLAACPHDQIKPLARYAIQLSADATYRLTKYTDADDWTCFLGLLNAHHWRTKRGI